MILGISFTVGHMRRGATREQGKSRRKELSEPRELMLSFAEPHIPTRILAPVWAQVGALAAFLWGCL